MKRRDFVILLCAMAAASVFFLVSRQGPLPSAAQVQGAQQAASPSAALEPAECYLLATVCGVVFAPYPLLEEWDLPITQADGKKNIVHVSPEGFYMISSTCDNQDCVHQGSVSLQNRDLRLLGNMVLCLPNQVMLELLSPEEAQRVWGNADGQ